jgi:hypothetical protein
MEGSTQPSGRDGFPGQLDRIRAPTVPRRRVAKVLRFPYRECANGESASAGKTAPRTHRSGLSMSLEAHTAPLLHRPGLLCPPPQKLVRIAPEARAKVRVPATVPSRSFSLSWTVDGLGKWTTLDLQKVVRPINLQPDSEQAITSSGGGDGLLQVQVAKNDRSRSGLPP